MSRKKWKRPVLEVLVSDTTPGVNVLVICKTRATIKGANPHTDPSIDCYDVFATYCAGSCYTLADT